MSHPAWVCGLKHALSLAQDKLVVSHPAWVCGLKHTSYYLYLMFDCHTLRGCVD